MRRLFLILILCAIGSLAYAQQAEKIVAGDTDASIVFVDVSGSPNGGIYSLKDVRDWAKPTSMDFETYADLGSGVNARFADSLIATRIFREILPLSELIKIKDRSITVRVVYNSAGKLMDMSFIFGTNRNPALQVLTPARMRELFIRMRDRAVYRVTETDPRMDHYTCVFYLWFDDIIANRSILCTNRWYK